MARRSILASVAVAASLALGAGTSLAHTFTTTTSLSIGKAPAGAVERGDRVVIFGTLNSSEPTCEQGEKVKLFRKRPGLDQRLDSDTTDAEGEYRFRIRPRRDMKVYTSFDGSVESSYGHSHTCGGDTSNSKRINVD